jgi:hypothetical protein
MEFAVVPRRSRGMVQRGQVRRPMDLDFSIKSCFCAESFLVRASYHHCDSKLRVLTGMDARECFRRTLKSIL